MLLARNHIQQETTKPPPHWLPVAAHISFKALMLACKAKNGPAPPDLLTMVKSQSQPQALQALSTVQLGQPSSKMLFLLSLEKNRNRPYMVMNYDYELSQTYSKKRLRNLFNCPLKVERPFTRLLLYF